MMNVFNGKGFTMIVLPGKHDCEFRNSIVEKLHPLFQPFEKFLIQTRHRNRHILKEISISILGPEVVPMVRIGGRGHGPSSVSLDWQQPVSQTTFLSLLFRRTKLIKNGTSNFPITFYKIQSDLILSRWDSKFSGRLTGLNVRPRHPFVNPSHLSGLQVAGPSSRSCTTVR